MTDLKIDAEARSRLRAAITSHNGWRAYKDAVGKGIAEFTKDDYLTACAALGLNAASIINQSEGSEMKERTKDAHTVNQLRLRFADTAGRMDTATAEKCRAILLTIDTRQNGWATDAQHAAIERAVIAVEIGGKADTASAPVTVNAPALGAKDPAGKAIADLVAPHIAELVNSHVMASVEKRLETVSRVQIELKREGATVGTADGHHHPLFATLCRALAARQADGFAPNVWISGPAGSGKTHAAKTFAKAAGMPFHFNGSLSMPHELLGFIDGTGTCHRTPFREAFEHGGIYLFDEVDGCADNTPLLALNPALANGRCSFPDKVIDRHPDCVIIATANTHGMGATSDYVGRCKIDGAFLDRFGVRLNWGYDTALEIAISGNPDFARRVQAARERARSAGLKVIISPRATMAGAALIAGGMSPDDAAGLTYLANLSAEQVKIVEGR